MDTGTVTRVQGGRYDVRLDESEALVEASLRGRVKTEARTGDRVVIGDRVRVAGGGDGGFVIEEVLPRSTELVRRGPGGRRPKVLVANLDRLVVVVSAVRPDVRPELVDRLLVVSESSGMAPIVVINKMDLEGAEPVAAALSRSYESIGYRVILTSAVSGRGLTELSSVLCTGGSALIGPSGVGKSSLLNAVEPDLHLRVGDVSERIGRGRHTTVAARLLTLGCGGVVADTPGFGDVGVWGVEPEHLDRLFPEFRPLLGQCRFRGCSHLQEPDCAVLAAVADGTVQARRHASYRTLREEAA